MTDPRVAPPVAPVGITQRELVDFGAVLVEQGLPSEVVARVTHRLQEIAAEAAFKGAGELAITVEEVRRQEALKWREYTDNVLRQLRNVIRGSATTLGYINRDTVIANINSLITTPEPGHQAPRQIGR